MNVEMLGLPGSGKSTLNAAILSWLSQNGWMQITFDELERRNRRLKPLLRNNSAARHVYRRDKLERQHPEFLAIAERVLSPYPVQKAMFLQSAIHHVTAREMANELGLMLSDEGLWHRLLYAFARQSEIGSSEFSGCLNDGMRPDVLIYIETSPEQCLESVTKRMEARGVVDPEEKAIERHGPLNALQNRRDLFQVAVDFFERNGVKVISLKGLTCFENMLETACTGLNLTDVKPKTLATS